MNQLLIDLGTTFIKYTLIDKNKKILRQHKEKSPTVKMFNGLLCAKPDEYLKVIKKIIEQTDSHKKLKLHIASQRSTYTIWKKNSLKTIIPMINWQDTSGEKALHKFEKYQNLIKDKTGLFPNPHYIALKNKALEMEGKFIRYENNSLLLGTLDTYLIWLISKKKLFITDPTMASRTLYFNIEKEDWDHELVKLFLPPSIQLPRIIPSINNELIIDKNITLGSMAADQNLAFQGLINDDKKRILINLGTGGFILKYSQNNKKYNSRYLISPLLRKKNKKTFALEATINSIGDLGKIQIQGLNHKNKFINCFPDKENIGSPFWTTNPSAEVVKNLKTFKLMRMEALLFRIKHILDDWEITDNPPIFLSGGITYNKDFIQNLSTFLKKEINIFKDVELTTTGLLHCALPVEILRNTPMKINIYKPKRISINSTLKRYNNWKIWANNFY